MLSAGCRCGLGAVQSARGASPRLLTALQQNGNRVLVGGPVQIQVATMKATFGEKYPYSEPFAYETTQTKWYHEWTDSVYDRFNENSKMIIVEGNLAVGKNDFAKRLAHNFDLKYYPSVVDGDFWCNGIQLTSLNEILPETAKFYDMQLFLDEKHPENGKLALLQMRMYWENYMRYVRATEHLLNTGQGVVLTKSAFSEFAYVDAFKKMGFLKPNYYRYFKRKYFPFTCGSLLKPHLTIFLDAPVSTCMQRLKERNRPDAHSPHINERLFTELETSFRKNLMPEMKKAGEVVTFDWSHVASDLEMDEIVDEIAAIKLHAEDNEGDKFMGWYCLDENEYSLLRRQYDRRSHLMDQILEIPLPHDFECPELYMTSEDAEESDKIIENHPLLAYSYGYAPGFDNTLLKFADKEYPVRGLPREEQLLAISQ